MVDMVGEVGNKRTQEDPNQLVAQFQTYQMQMESVSKSLDIAKIQLMEIDKALEELGKTSQKSAYKISGQIMVNKPVEDLKKDLGEMKENIQLQTKSIERSRERIGAKMTEIQGKLKEMMK